MISIFKVVCTRDCLFLVSLVIANASHFVYLLCLLKGNISRLSLILFLLDFEKNKGKVKVIGLGKEESYPFRGRISRND